MAIDLLGLQPNVISRDLRSKYILLSGAPKIGKTEFCSLAPDALILAFERGTNARPGAMVQPISTWAEFKTALRQLENPKVKEKFSTVCIDTVGVAYDACEQFVCQQNGVTKIGDVPYGAGYSALSKEFESSLRKITNLEYGLIMTCHLKESYDEEGLLLSRKPDLNNRCLKIVNGLVDVIAVITQNWNDKGESERWIQTRATPNITAGSRFKYLAPRIPFSYKEFVSAIAAAVDAEEADGAVVVDTIQVSKTEVLDYVQLMNEARTFWMKKLEEAPDEDTRNDIGRRMSKKVEMVFGQKIKLSEVTEDQVELLKLALDDLKSM